MYPGEPSCGWGDDESHYFMLHLFFHCGYFITCHTRFVPRWIPGPVEGWGQWGSQTAKPGQVTQSQERWAALQYKQNSFAAWFPYLAIGLSQD